MSVERIARRTRDMSAERIARNDAIFREANEQIRDFAETLDIQTPLAFICECADPECREIVQLTLEQYRELRSDPRHFVNVEGHQVAAGDWGEVVAQTDGHVTVEKLGRAGEIVEQLEGRDDPATAEID